MDKSTREALLGSIEKWKRIVAGIGEDYGAINCPLCTMFLTTKRCRGCPVCETTGQPGCIKSPYVDYMRYQYSNPRYTYTERLQAAAEAELAFLQSLLPLESGE